MGLAFDSQGNLFVADSTSEKILKIDPSGAASVVAGSDDNNQPNTGPALETTLSPYGLAFDSTGRLVFADQPHYQVLELDLSTGTIAVLAGNGSKGFSGDGGPATEASLYAPQAIATDDAGAVYFVDAGNRRVRAIREGGISTVAGSGPLITGTAASLRLDGPEAVAVGQDGTVYIADTGNQLIRKVEPSGAVSNFGPFPGTEETLTVTGFQSASVTALANDLTGNLYATVTGSVGNPSPGTGSYREGYSSVFRIDPTGTSTRVAGKGNKLSSEPWDPTSGIQLKQPRGVGVDQFGNVFIAGKLDYRISRVYPGGFRVFVAGTGNWSSSVGGDGPASTVAISPWALTVDADGNVIFTDVPQFVSGINHAGVVRKLDLNGNLTTLAGNGVPGNIGGGDGGPATSASLTYPVGVAVDKQGAIYVSDRLAHVVRRVSPAGYITTIAGNGEYLPQGDFTGAATEAALDPRGIAVDDAGNLYVADAMNGRVRVLTPTPVPVKSIEMVDGNNQSGPIYSELPIPLSVKLTDPSGAPYPGVLVYFDVPYGSAAVTPARAFTNSDGIASTKLTFGSVWGAVDVIASTAGLAGVAFRAVAQGPTIESQGVVGAAQGTSTIARFALFSIYGTLLSDTTHALTAEDLVDGQVPVNLGGVCVNVGGVPAPLFYVSPGQINAQMPDVPNASGAEVTYASVTVVEGCGTSSSLTVNPGVYASVTDTSPEIFSSGKTTNGFAVAAAVNSTTGELIGPPDLQPGVTYVPAKAGDNVAIFGTGFGPLQDPLAAGQPAASAIPITNQIVVQIGDITVPDADVGYAGAAPGFAGLNQLNIRIPQGLPDGLAPLSVTINGIRSPDSIYIQIGN